MKKIDEAVRSARDVYVEQDYERCLSVPEQAEEAMGHLEKQAIRLKDTAMMWIYTVE